MSKEKKAENDWELFSLAEAISTFFSHRVEGEGGVALAALTREMTLKAGFGTSHIEAKKAEEIYHEWSSLPAVGSEEENQPLVRTEDGKLYFRRFFEYEQQVAMALSYRLGDNSNEFSDMIDEGVIKSLDELQMRAVKTTLQRDLLLLTGGPGTGKTRTIVGILVAQLQKKPDTRIALAAPTGKAAFRMKESVLRAMESFELSEEIRSALLDCSRATTLHRLLESKIGTVDFRRNKENPLPHDLVVVDEASMVDLPLMAKLCSSLSDESKLVLIGDADQLAPVQGGAVFNGLIKATEATDQLSENFVRLTVNHRRSNSPAAAILSDLCDAIRDGEAEKALALAKSGEDSIRLIDNLNDPSIDQFIRSGFDGLTNAESPEVALSALEDFRILCPHNHGFYGVENWNRRAEGLLPSDQMSPCPVVIKVNDYTVGLFNGDDGICLGQRAYFGAEDGNREVAISRLPSHQLGYATSIHRSQGSEFDRVLIVLPAVDAKLLTRELLYVAVSRAKAGIILLGDEDSLIGAIQRSEESCSGVYDLLKRML